MGLFKSKQDKELEVRLATKKTLTQMKTYIQKLEEQKKVYIEAAKRAARRGLKDQYALALSGLRITVAHQKRAEQMLLNFEITSQLRDMSSLTTDFLKSMGALSKDMLGLTGNKEFAKVQKLFGQALSASEQQTERMELFMQDNSTAFAGIGDSAGTASDEELEKLIDEQVQSEESLADTDIDKELAALRRKLDSQN